MWYQVLSAEVEEEAALGLEDGLVLELRYLLRTSYEMFGADVEHGTETSLSRTHTL